MDINTSPARFGLVIVVIVALTTTNAQEMANENLHSAAMAARAISIVSGQ
jgi:hypothetical protein